MSLPCPRCDSRTYTYAHSHCKFIAEGISAIKRYRKCKACGGRFVSIEAFVDQNSTVLKSDPAEEPWYMQGAF